MLRFSILNTIFFCIIFLLTSRADPLDTIFIQFAEMWYRHFMILCIPILKRALVVDSRRNGWVNRIIFHLYAPVYSDASEALRGHYSHFAL